MARESSQAQETLHSSVLRVDDLPAATVRSLCERFAVRLERIVAGQRIPGSYWGEPEAGIIGQCVYVRGDTPIHSLLHELSHIICMTPERRCLLNTDAGGDHDEEAAVCYLQIALAASVAEIGRDRIFCDMDAWGYSFPEGNTREWFQAATEAREWLCDYALMKDDGTPAERLRSAR